MLFGTGRRICPSMSMAMATVALLEGRTADDVNMNEEGRLVCHRKTPLVLVPTVYRRGVKI